VACLRVFDNRLAATLHFDQEANTETGAFELVVLGGVVEFLIG
jgi:hypothetical protein